MASASIVNPDRESADATVIIVDDSAAFRAAALDVVRATPGFVAVAALPSAEGLREEVEQHPPDLVLMDVRMPGVDGVTGARTLSDLASPPTVVLLSADDCPDIASDPAAHGAVAFVVKQAFGPALLRSLRRRLRHRAPNC